MDAKQTPRLALHLDAPDLTPLHRVGMTGVWMSLKCLEEQYPLSSQRVGNLSWILTPKEIQLFWDGNDFEVLDWLLKQAFQIDEEGLISFLALKSVTTETACKIVRHNLIRGTFLQHTQFFRSAGEKEEELLVNQVKIQLSYQRAKWYSAQDFAQKLCDQGNNLKKDPIKITSGLYPGAAIRHEKYRQSTAFEEKPALAFALLFAPIACRYYGLSPYIFDQHFLFAVIIPEVLNLQESAKACWRAVNRDYYNFYASCSAEASLKEGAMLPTLPKRLEILVFGKTRWLSQQKTITQVKTISVTESMAQFYQQLCQCFPKEQLAGFGKVHYSFFRAVICENFVAELPWWSGFLEGWSAFLKQVTQFDSETRYFFLRGLFQQGKGLRQMIEKVQLSNEQQVLFVKVCHQALQYIYARIYAKTGEGEYPRIQRENEDILRKLENCQSPSQFREFMVRFWAKAGHPKLLQQHWEELMPVTTGQADWKLCQDLVFLAIASYPISQKQEAQSQETNDSSTES